MKKLPLLSLLSFALLGIASSASAILITVDGINVTNAGGVLVPDVPQGDLPNQSSSAQFAWLQGQVVGYNLIIAPAASLPAPTGIPGSPTIQDDDASSNGSYSLLEGMEYYVVSHYGKSNTAWYIAPAADGLYGMPNQASDFGFPTGDDAIGKGLSNVRIWKVNVPDGGVTIALLGFTFLTLGVVRRRLASKYRLHIRG